MANITRNGSELASKLNPAIGTTRAIEETCSLITRHAGSHHRIQEEMCNGPHGVEYMTNGQIERWEGRIAVRDARIEALIARHINSLPHTDEGPIKVKFGGDPRGSTVKLVMPGELTRMHDDWGQEGICVPI